MQRVYSSGNPAVSTYFQSVIKPEIRAEVCELVHKNSVKYSPRLNPPSELG